MLFALVINAAQLTGDLCKDSPGYCDWYLKTEKNISPLYQLDAFDWTVLIVYFGILTILAIYGVYRVKQVTEFWRYRKFPPSPKGAFAEDQLPHITVQLPHFNGSYNLLTRLQTIMLDGHFVIEQTTRNRSGNFFNFNGTAGIWRREAIEMSGGWQHDTLTEDTDLSFRAQLMGWRFVYLLDEEAPAEIPVDINAFKAQQRRWAKGVLQVWFKLYRRIWGAPLPLRVKVEMLFG